MQRSLGASSNALSRGRLLTRMSSTSSFSQHFEGKSLTVKGTFIKEIHTSSSACGLDWKILEFEVDSDCVGWQMVKAAVRAAPPLRNDSSMDANVFMWLKKSRKAILEDESHSISVLGRALCFVKVGQRGRVTGTLALKPSTSQVQIMATGVEVLDPETNVQLESMLVGMIDGVGEKTAQVMVTAFGNKILNVLNSDEAVAKLSRIKGMGVIKAKKIKKQWDESASKTLLHQRLQSQYGIPPLLSLSVVERLSSLISMGKEDPSAKAGDNELVSLLRQDPYSVLLGVVRLSFTDVDNLAARLGGVSANLKSRASFAIAQTLSNNASDGLTHTDWNRIKLSSLKLMKESAMGKWDEEKVQITSAAVEFSQKGFIVLEQIDKEGKRTLVADAGSLLPDTRVYLKTLYAAETQLAEMLSKRISECWDLKLVDPIHDSSSTRPNAEGLTSEQVLAIKMALNSPISLLTGGAGVGKTSTCRVIIKSWMKAGKRVAVCAPTGRASQRLQEAMWDNKDVGAMPEATTIHRLLGFKGGSDQDAQSMATSPEGSRLSEYLTGLSNCQFDASNPLPIDCLLIDESSMLDLQLAHALFTALPHSCQVLFVGDHNQLPPVGCGHVLAALLSLRRSITDHPAIARVHLDKIFRSSSSGAIVAGALQIMNGLHPISMKATSVKEIMEMMPEGGKNKISPKSLAERLGSDAFLIEVPDSIDQNELETLAVDLTAALKSSGIDVLNSLQLLSPLVRGSSSLNVRSQAVMNPRGGGRLGLHDRVMQVSNNYEKQVFNGELGTVTYVSDKDKMVRVSFPRQGKPHIVAYQGLEDRELALAWSTTIHKSQGGEYPAVLLLLDHNGLGLLGSRQLLYTAVTRSKELLIVISTSSALRICLRGDVVSSGGGGGLCIASRAASELQSLGRDAAAVAAIPRPSTSNIVERQVEITDHDRSNTKWAVKPSRMRIKL